MRTIHEIAGEILQHQLNALMKTPGRTPTWVSYSQPYVMAMRELNSITDRYYLDSGYEIVLRAKCNMINWRGPDARRIKAELDELLASCPRDKHV